MAQSRSNDLLQRGGRAVKTDGMTVLSAFTGIGGLDLGLELAGFKTIACIEKDPTARKSLYANRKTWPLMDPGDIEVVAPRLSPKSFGLKRGELSLLAGASPCQPFSKAAQWSANGRSGIADPRSRCVDSFLSLVERFLPKVVLMENVRGFIVGPNSAMPKIEASLGNLRSKHGISYRLEGRVLNSADYGVPQRRERAIIVAIRDGEHFQWPVPTHRDRPVRAWDALANLTNSKGPEVKGRWAGLLPSIPEGRNYLWHTDRGGGRPLFAYRSRYWSFLLKLSRHEPSWTIPAQPGPGTGPFHWDNRHLTVSELLRIQSFPASWKVCGNYREQVKQIGNATPPLLAEIIGRAIAQQVFGMTYDSRCRFLISRKKLVPPHSKPRPVVKKFRSLEANRPPHPGTGKGPRPILRNEAT